MDIVISHISALRLIRQLVRWRELVPEPSGLPSRMPTPKEACDLQSVYPCLVEKTEVLLNNVRHCHVSPVAQGRVWTTPLPAEAFIELSPGVRCASPLFIPVLLASYLGKWEMRLLLAELMGLYSVAQNAQMGLVQRREPLVTRAELLAFLDKLGSARGTKIVRAALNETPELAASPLEAKLYLRATLPLARGGYGMQSVVLNSPVEVRRIAAGIKTFQIRKPDLLFIGPAGNVCLDYMGAWHDKRASVDARRRNELLANGFKPYEIFKDNYDDLRYMDDLMRAIRDDLGIAPAHLTHEQQERNRQARHKLWSELERVNTSFYPGDARSTALPATDVCTNFGAN